MADQTRLERVVGALTKAAGGLVVGGLVVLLANALVIDQKKVHIIGLGALRAGLLVVLLIIVTVLVSVVAGKVRGKGQSPDQGPDQGSD
ncbi:cation transporter-like permease [Marmoricola sp. OAE513]|uniref:hypothetical protein n=1 Tax=Marmoricola sp. OAE513 TaxID=2817894 RepID=UPI001AE1D03E